MVDVVTLLAAAVFVTFGIHRLVILRGDEANDPAQRYVSGFAWCLGMAMFFSSPAVEARLHRHVRAEPWLWLTTHELRICALGFLVLVALSLKAPVPDRRSVRRQRGLALAVLAVSAGLLLFAGTSVADGLLVTPDDRRWALASCNAVFMAYGSWCLSVLARELTRNARRTAPGPLRAGLRLMTAAAAVGAVWVLWVWEDVLENLADGQQRLGENAVCGTLGVITAVMGTGGATATLWGGALGAPVRWLRAYRRHRALEPLWSALHTELPQIALDPSTAAHRPGLRRAEFALYRRVIEIRDGHLALRPYFHTDVSRWAAESADRSRDHRAVLEAATIAAALESKRSGRRNPDVRCSEHIPPAVPGTIEAEADWLLEVTNAFTSSPTVAAVRHRVRASTPEHDTP